MPIRHFDVAYLTEAIGSLKAQTSDEWRLLVIDDTLGPRPTGLHEALSPWLADDRIEIVPTTVPRLAGAINTGMAGATTEFVALLFADDLWDPIAVDVVTRNIRAHPDVDFFHSSRRFVDDDGHPVSSVYEARHGVAVADFFEGSPVHHLLCWRRSMGLDVGGMDEKSLSVGPDDFDFPWTMAERGARFGAIDQCLYIVRDHRRIERLTTHLPLRVHVRETRRILRKHGTSRWATRRRVAEARSSYLKQCLYRFGFEARLRQRFRSTPRVWREPYR